MPPRKPTGNLGPLHFTTDEVIYERIKFPEEKEEIEKYIVGAFCKSLDCQNLKIKSCTINDQNDFDFKIRTNRGSMYLELMEIAPLEHLKGSYSNADSSYNSYEFANYIISKIMKKSDKYRGAKKSRIVLLTYITNWTFVLNETSIALLQNHLAKNEHSFESAYYYMPFDQNKGIANLLHPTPIDFWSTFNPEDYKDNVVHNIQLE